MHFTTITTITRNLSIQFKDPKIKKKRKQKIIEFCEDILSIYLIGIIIFCECFDSNEQLFLLSHFFQKPLHLTFHY